MARSARNGGLCAYSERKRWKKRLERPRLLWCKVPQWGGRRPKRTETLAEKRAPTGDQFKRVVEQSKRADQRSYNGVLMVVMRMVV